MSVDLQAIRYLLAAATPGPWRARPEEGTGNRESFRLTDADGRRYLGVVDQLGDANLIVHAAPYLAALLAEVEQLQTVLEAARGIRQAYYSPSPLPRYAMSSAVDDLDAALNAYDAGGGAMSNENIIEALLGMLGTHPDRVVNTSLVVGLAAAHQSTNVYSVEWAELGTPGNLEFHRCWVTVDTRLGPAIRVVGEA